MPGTAPSTRRYHVTLAAFTILTLLYLILIGWTHFRMPETIPVHFNGAGDADRWSSKGEFTAIMGVIGLLMFFVFAGTAVSFHRIPNRYWNLPNRDYWLADDRREETIATLNVYYLAMGIATLVLLLYVHWGVYQVAMEMRETLSLRIGDIVMFLLLIAVLCYLLVRRFWRVPEAGT